MAELHELTMLEQAAAVRQRQVSSTELVEHYLDRIDAHDAALGAFVTVTAEQARDQARAADRVADEHRAPLHGVPMAFNDLTLTNGVRTTFGCRVFANFVPAFDAPVVTALHTAGMISLGKTHASEFGNALYC